MRAQEFVIEPHYLDESIASRIDDWIENTLRKLLGEPADYDKMTPWLSDKVAQAMKDAPTEPVSQQVLDKIIADARIQKELEQAAWAQKTTVEKIKQIIYMFGGKFVSEAAKKWQRMSERDRSNLISNTFKALLELVLIILNALIKSRR